MIRSFTNTNKDYFVEFWMKTLLKNPSEGFPFRLWCILTDKILVYHFIDSNDDKHNHNNVHMYANYDFD